MPGVGFHVLLMLIRGRGSTMTMICKKNDKKCIWDNMAGIIHRINNHPVLCSDMVFRWAAPLYICCQFLIFNFIFRPVCGGSLWKFILASV